MILLSKSMAHDSTCIMILLSKSIAYDSTCIMRKNKDCLLLSPPMGRSCLRASLEYVVIWTADVLLQAV